MSDHEMENAGAGDATAEPVATTPKENGIAGAGAGAAHNHSEPREKVDDSDHMMIDSDAPAIAVIAPQVNGTKTQDEPKEEANGVRETDTSTVENDGKTTEGPALAKPEVSSKQINGEAAASGPTNSHEPRAIRDLSSVSTMSVLASAKKGPPSVKVEKEIARLQEAVDEASPEAARQILHKNWRKFLFEDVDDMHVIFVLRALLKNCSFSVMERVSKDGNLFKGNILKAAVKSDVVASQILGSKEIVDQLCADRIREVDAKVLLNWLAKGRRLGYSENDIMEINGWVHPDTHNNANDVVMMDSHPTPNGFPRPPPPAPPAFRAPPPNNQPPPPHNPLPSPGHAPQQPLPQQSVPQQPPPQQAPPPALQPVLPASGGRMVCNYCSRTFDHVSGFNYHHLKKVCTKEPPATGWKWTCEFCFQGFTTKQGREYHNLKGVCETCDIPPTTPLLASSTPQTNFQAGTVPSSVPTPPAVPSYAAPFPGPPPAPVPTITRPPLHTPVSSQPVVNSSVVASQPTNARPGTIQRPPLRTPSTATPPVAAPVHSNTAVIGSNTPSTNGSFNAENSINGSTSGPNPAAHQPFNTPGSGVAHPSTPRSRTPGTRTQAPRTDIRQSPSELPPEKLAQLDNELAAEDSKYEVARQQAESLDEPERSSRLISLKNGLASKKSTIRRRYGVSLRLRERDKLAQKASMNNRLRSEDSTPQNSVAPASGFSPINTIVSAPTGFSPINATRTAPSPLTDYGSPYLATANSNQPRPSIPAPHGFSSPHPASGHPTSRLSTSTSRRSSEQDTPEGFGVLVRRDSRNTRYNPQNQMTPTTFAAAQKRRRGSLTEDEGAARPSPGPPQNGFAKQGGASNGNSYRTPYAPSASNLSSDSRPGSASSHPAGSAQAAIQAAKNGKQVGTTSRNSTPSSSTSDTAMGGVPVSAAPGVDDVVPTTEKAPPTKAPPQIVELSSDDDSDDEDIPA
ncbi:hypothetical protein HYFRA_00002918 [Hymenoscyphus fraxineus]|uniref:Uncharacterized protein n=1 Tax=Hymenoscyphus fraxineus TaxID=746836 RepID=A0A9N9PPJ4_9HELO|nr:hypothetical protein HYFRA_00002918 [Hymenoscyphus fraxineus]